MAHEWSPQQAKALDAVGAWLKDPNAPQVFRLFGYAGTGKTTLAQHLVMGSHFPIFAAFTGKAASVLRNKGCPNAMTLHSLLYNVSDRDKQKLMQLESELSMLSGNEPDYAERKAEVDFERDKVKRPWFHVNEESKLKLSDILVCDEVSMVDKKLGQDMESFGKKILVLGDPAQLPPVAGGGYFTNQKPDILLTEIHRQAADNPILRWATMARKGEVIPYGDLGLAKKFKREKIDDAWLAAAAGQVLCGKNETRFNLNQRIRKQLGRTSIFPVYRDRLVVLQNNHKLGILNGGICMCANEATLDERDPNVVWMSIVYEKQLLRDLRVASAVFEGREVTREFGVQQLDFGYALTVHKAQGSQWPTVTVYDDGFGKRNPEERRRWLYTAITRAEVSLNIVTS